MVWWIIGALLYFIVPPLTIFGIHRIHREYRIDRPQQPTKKNGKKRKKVDPKKLPDPLRDRYRELLKFARKNKMHFKITKTKTIPVQTRVIFYGIWLVGFIVATVGFGLQMYLIGIVGLLLWYAYYFFGLLSSRRPVRTINRMMETMYGIARSNLRYEADQNYKTSKAITVTKWKDPVTPQEIEFELGTNLNEGVKEPFMLAFNLYFGQESAWVPSYDSDRGHNGWDFKNRKLNIYSVPPLPQSSDWKSWYVVNEAVSPQFFPIGECVEGGLELTDPETNETKHIMGFDLSGRQKSYAEKAGVRMSGKIVQAPQVLVAGRTGGGKAEDVNTPVAVFREDELTDVA